MPQGNHRAVRRARLSFASLPNQRTPSFEITVGSSGEASIFAEASAFAAPPAGFEALRVAVTPSAQVVVPLNCGEIVLGFNSQVECALPPIPNLTVRSEDPARLVVSADPAQVGRAEINGVRGRMVLQGLTSSGTVEVVVSAPGYAEARVAVVLRPSEIVVANRPDNQQVVLARGGAQEFSLEMVVSGPRRNSVAPRAGVQIPVRLTVTPPGIVTVEPVTVNLSQTQASRAFTVRGLAAGTALIRIVADGYAESAQSGLTVRVTP